MFKKLSAVIMAGVMAISLCACQNENLQEKNENALSKQVLQEAEAHGNTEKTETDFKNRARMLAEIICDFGLKDNDENFYFDSENADFRNFIIMLAAYGYPDENFFPKDENGLYHFPEEAIERIIYETFGIEEYELPWSDEKGAQNANFNYDGEKKEFTNGLEFGTGGGPSVKNASVSADGDKITVDFILSDNVGFIGEPGWNEYGDYRMTFIVMEDENGKFLRFESFECVSLYAPLIIADHIAALNEVFGETFFADFDYYGKSYARLFIEEQVKGTTADAVPDFMMSRKEIAEKGIPEGYYKDASEADCYLIENFTSKEGIRATLRKWLADEIFDGDDLTSIDENFIEYDGKLYLVRGGRGYGVQSCSYFNITEQTETEIKATGIYYVQGDYVAGTIDLLFSVDGNNIILETFVINRE